MSTLNSSLSSSAKLVVVDMRFINTSLFNGRVSMAVFMLPGVILVFTVNLDLFSAVAVSGTASMYLAPVIFFSLWVIAKIFRSGAVFPALYWRWLRQHGWLVYATRDGRWRY